MIIKGPIPLTIVLPGVAPGTYIMLAQGPVNLNVFAGTNTRWADDKGPAGSMGDMESLTMGHLLMIHPTLQNLMTWAVKPSITATGLEEFLAEASKNWRFYHELERLIFLQILVNGLMFTTAYAIPEALAIAELIRATMVRLGTL